jgi:hypothetical protein
MGNLLINHPALVQKVGGHALAHVLYSYVRRSGRNKRRARRHVRKIQNRRRRWFVDNIIMHHKRLHDRNRELVITNARSRVLAKREAEARSAAIQRNKEGEQPQKPHDDHKNKISEIRGRLEAKRARTRSRWVSIVEDQGN